MRRTIYKYPIEVTDTQTVPLPVGAQILTAAMQGSKLMLWALVDPESPKVVQTIDVFGTGHPVDDKPRVYISTFMLENGALVFHVFRREP